MYEKNCLNYGFIKSVLSHGTSEKHQCSESNACSFEASKIPHSKYVLVCQMHPSSQQEREDFVSKINAIDTHAIMHTIHASTLRTTNDQVTLTLLTVVKGTSSVITCHKYETFISLLQLCHQKTKKKSGQSHKAMMLPFTVVAAKKDDTLLNAYELTVLAEKSLQWDVVLEISQHASSLVGTLHTHVHTCECEPS